MFTHKPVERIRSRYLMNGGPKNCACCREPLAGEILRFGEQYFCNEICVHRFRFRSSEAEEDAVEVCAECRGKIGLVRHHLFHLEFCSSGCHSNYLRHLHEKADAVKQSA